MKVREPNGPIQVAPVGLLGLLSLKTGGQMPDAMRQDLQPSVDFEPWWLRAKREFDRINRGVTVAPAGYSTYVDYSPNVIAVPETEWWYVHSYSVRARITAPGDIISAFRLAVRWNQVGTLRYRFVGEPSWQRVQTDADPDCLMLAEGFWVPPGAHIGFYIGSVAGGGMEVDVLGLDFTSLPL